MSFVSKSMVLRYFALAGTLVAASCTSIMALTPQQMSNSALNMVKVDPQTDPNPQTLAVDKVACANQARLQYPIGVDEGAIMTGSILGGAMGGAAGSAGTGSAGQATAAGSIAGMGQGVTKVQQTYVMQLYLQSTHYALCLVQQGHIISGPSERDLECARAGVGCPTERDLECGKPGGGECPS
jgi:hypothetical protein